MYSKHWYNSGKMGGGVRELEAELVALVEGPGKDAFQQAVAGAIEGARSEPSSASGSEDESGNLMEMLGLDDELLPFSELGAVVKGLQHGDIERAYEQRATSMFATGGRSTSMLFDACKQSRPQQ